MVMVRSRVKVASSGYFGLKGELNVSHRKLWTDGVMSNMIATAIVAIVTIALPAAQPLFTNVFR